MDWSWGLVGNILLGFFAAFGALRAFIEVREKLRSTQYLSVSVLTDDHSTYPPFLELLELCAQLRTGEMQIEEFIPNISDFNEKHTRGVISSEMAIRVHNTGSTTLENVRLLVPYPAVVRVDRSGSEATITEPFSSSPEFPLQLDSMHPGERIKVHIWASSEPFRSVKATHKNGHGKIVPRYPVDGFGLWLATNYPPFAIMGIFILLVVLGFLAKPIWLALTP